MQESGEMYLETILVLSRDRNDVRAIDVGQKMAEDKTPYKSNSSVIAS